jgi:cell division protein ZapA
MGDLSIKLRIGDREYPMRVAAEDEARFRTTGKVINEKLRAFRDNYGIDDRQDLLAMAAIDSQAALLASMDNSTGNQDKVFALIGDIEQVLDEALKSE